jgi:SAM-dependent methyltransferase
VAHCRESLRDEKEEAMTRHQDSGLAWNARRGNVWVDLQPTLDRLFLPFEHVLTDAALARDVGRVLDIGCGTGATTVAIANRLGPHGECTGIDVSEAMLNLARQRAIAEGAPNARFLVGDAERHRFPPNAFDAVVSRFGVMFFDDPAAAFANIGNAVRPGGALTWLAWRSREENPFMTAAERATGHLLRSSNQPAREAPGPFALANPDRVSQLLTVAGWRDVQVGALNVSCTLPKAELTVYTHRMGPVGMVLPDLDPALQRKVIATLEDAFVEFLVDDIAKFNAACWVIRARAG